MNFETAYKQVEGINGWMGPSDSRVIFEEASKVDGLIVEVGPYMGRSTKLIALASPNSKIIAIDPYIEGYYTGEDMNYAKDKFLRNLKGFNVELINDTSQNAGKKWNKTIDFLHIDGDHSYEAVMTDIKLFVPHVRSGGVVMLHDFVINGKPEELIQKMDDRYYDKSYGVLRAVNESRKYFSDISTLSGFAKCIKS